MSGHNDHFRFGESLLSAAYSDQAQGEAEGARARQLGWGDDMAEGAAESAGRVRQLGRRRMGNAYAPDAQGSAEGEGRAAQLGDLNPLNAESNRGRFSEARFGVSGHMVTDGRVGHMADVREDYYRAHPLSGLREDDADLRLRGLREDDADLRLRGLREDDANLRLRGVRSLGRNNEQTHFLTRQLPGGTAYRGLGSESLYHDMGDRNVAFNQYRRMGNDLLRDGMPLDGLREDDARLKMRGVGNFRSSIALRGINNLRGLREDDADLRLRGLREDDANLHLRGLREEDAAVMLRGIGTVNDLLSYRSMGASDFHPRFPVKVEIEGVGTIGLTRSEAKMAGLFSFLTPNPTWEEFAGRCNTLLQQWIPLRNTISQLPPAQLNAINQQMAAADRVSAQDYDQVQTMFLAEGPPGYAAHQGRAAELTRLEAYLPTLQKVVAQMAAMNPNATPGQLTAAATNTALTSLNSQIAGQPTDIMGSYALPALIGVGLIGGLLFLTYKPKKKGASSAA